MARQGQFGLVRVDEGMRFVEVIPQNGSAPILHVGDHPKLGRVTFNLDGKRFRNQGLRLAMMGASGAGKSNGLAVLAEEVHRIGYPLVVFDQEGEFLSLADLPGVRVVGGNEEGGFKAGEVVEFVLAGGGGAVVDVSESSFERQRMVFSCLAEAFYELAGEVRRRCFFVVDEASVIAPQRRAGGAEGSRRWLEHLVSRGRKRGIYTMLATQRPSALSKDVLAQFNVKLIGRLDIWQDLGAVRPYLSRRVDMTEIARLAAGRFLLDVSGFTQVVRVRRRATRDLGGTPTR